MRLWRRIRAGFLNARVTFERQQTTGQNSSGEDTIGSPTVLGTAWVQIEALVGKERERAQQVQAEAQYLINMEHPLSAYTLRRNDTIRWGSKTLNIIDVQDPDQSRGRLVIQAMEYVQ